MEKKPAPYVANEVYRELIKNSKEKTFESIVSLSTEIAHMQGKQFKFYFCRKQRLCVKKLEESSYRKF